MKCDYRPPIHFTEREVMLSFTMAINQSESWTQACHVRIIIDMIMCDCQYSLLFAHLVITKIKSQLLMDKINSEE